MASKDALCSSITSTIIASSSRTVLAITRSTTSDTFLPFNNKSKNANHLPRRLLLASTIASPLLLHTQNSYPSSSDAEDFVDPAEQALVETLDARDSLALLCKNIKMFTSRNVSKAELQNPRRALGGIYESLASSLPKVAEEFELEEDTVQEVLYNFLNVLGLLESLASAQDAFIRSCLAVNPSAGLESCSKFLELACVQVDELLEQVPMKMVEATQLLRGIRPRA